MSLGKCLQVLSFLISAAIWAAAPFGRYLQRTLLPSVIENKEMSGIAVVLGSLLYLAAIVRSKAYRVAVLGGFSALIPAFFLIMAVDLPIEWVHVIEYGVLGFCVSLGWGRAALWKVALAANAVSVLDEGIQGLTPDRVADLRDLWINFLGVTVGLCFAAPVRSTEMPKT